MSYCPKCGARLDEEPPTTCAACGTQHWRNAKPCGGALLVRDGRVLLVRRAIDPWRGLWDIPGGFCDEREHPAAAAERELFEETGLRGRADRLLGMWIDEYDGEQVCLNIYFVCEPADSGGEAAVADPDEVSELGWFGPDELPFDEISFPDHCRQVLEAWRRDQAEL